MMRRGPYVRVVEARLDPVGEILWDRGILVRWRLKLQCGHEVERAAHRDGCRIELPQVRARCRICSSRPETDPRA
jgi:hypothetical protein